VKVGTVIPIAESDGPGRPPTWPEARDFAQHADHVGLDSLWVADHLYGNEQGQAPQGVHESWTLLCGVAASTQRIALGHLVTCASFRSPGVVAKMAVTADAISGGRLTLGLGAGWNDAEYVAFGFPTDHRVSRFEEWLEIVVRLLRGETVTYQGRYQTVMNAVLLPPPERPIPILVAGDGPRMLGLTARHADAWNTAWFGKLDDHVDKRLAAMDAAMSAAGRDRSSLTVSVGVVVRDADGPAAADRAASLIDGCAERKVDEVVVLLQPMTKASLDRLAQGRKRAGVS
jgi:alkanesulfonate monooxygenase SsuD/methylene tetrahydromethanopterin reductase-like flavin-dependent oxidoreductase (luciferase family)